MKLVKSNIILFISVITTLSLALSLLGSQGSVVDASAAAETKATQNCSSINGADQLATQRRNACHKGFVAGYDGGNKTNTCKKYSGSVKSACNSAYDKGKSAKSKAPETDGREGAAAKKSKAQACGKYQNKANKATCEKAYDNQIKSMAQLAGEKAGKAGSPSPCGNLGFGGQGAKTACEDAYKKGLNEAGKSARGHCGNVETYFDFSNICKDENGQDTNTKSGGEGSPIVALGLAVVGWITALVVLGVVGGIVYGGFLYLTARDVSSQTQKGVTVITNSVVALIAWVFAYALINFLVPGGLFNG